MKKQTVGNLLILPSDFAHPQEAKLKSTRQNQKVYGKIKLYQNHAPDRADRKSGQPYHTGGTGIVKADSGTLSSDDPYDHTQ